MNQESKESNQKTENTAGETEKAAGNGQNENIKEVLKGVDIADGSTGKNSESQTEENNAQKSSEAETVENASDDEIGKLKKEVESMKDAWTRERAEFMNYKKRISLEQARYKTEIVSEFAKNLFSVIDNLDRVLQVENPDESLKNFLSGVEMIKKEFMDVLAKENIRQLNPVNEEFDPYKMEALAMEDRSDIDKDMVLEVFQYGYVYEKDENDVKVLRPARVKVAKKA